jgi:nitrogen fixation/metabolism regulation signal transduction histidine kinase
MKYNILGIVVLVAGLSVSIQHHLIWPSIALGVLLLWLCASLYGRMSRMLYAYRETEKENERLHTRLAEAERQLQYLRQLTENVDTALFVCSTDGRIDWMNHAAKEIHQNQQTLQTHPCPSLQTHPLPLPVREGSSYTQRQNAHREQAAGLSTPLPHREGQGVGLQGAGLFLPPHILQAIAAHAEVVNGCALSTVLLRIDSQRRLVVALKDVSMLMQRQEMEAWQQLIRVLTHEIMNSLTPIISISETLTNENEAFAVINRRCHALLDFVESYRQLTRIKIPERATFPINELLEHIKGLYPQIKTQGEGLLTADRAQLEQVLINLIKNAYESGATKVEVSANESEIRIHDNGSGMSPDVVDHAFIPFFTTKPNGTGIGLSLCRQIILKHGGTIRMESEEGKGTTFIITLPSHSF